MKKVVFLVILLLTCLICFAQGTVAGNFSIFPDEKCKDSFLLCGRTVSIQDSSFSYYDTYDVLNFEDAEE